MLNRPLAQQCCVRMTFYIGLRILPEVIHSLQRDQNVTTEIIPGRYRHFRGNEYQVLDTARHSETEEVMVVYRCLYGDHSLWVRPLSLFASLVEVEIDGQLKSVPRFALIEPVDDRLADSGGLV